MGLDIEFVRRQFPALAGDWVYMDNAGGSQILGSVLDRMRDYLVHTNVQLGATYEPSARATARVTEAREGMARMINAADAGEVIMGSSTSMLIRILATCLASSLQPGDEIIVSNCDHEANIGPWMELEKNGIIVKTWGINRDSFRMESDDLQRLVTERTRLVAVTHTSNIVGTINPIREYADIAHAVGALICVDGVAYAPHRQVDVQRVGADFYVFSFYKTYGPHYAIMYAKREHQLSMPGINHYFIPQTDIPHKFQPGNVNYELSYAMLGLVDYLALSVEHHGVADVGDIFGLIAAHESAMAKRLLAYLDSKSSVTIIGERTADPSLRVPTVSFAIEGRSSDAVPPIADRAKIGIRFGDFYARRLIETLGLGDQQGVVRVSMVHYNTIEEVDRLIAVLDTTL